MKTLSGKRALITGAASGIGRALAVELARHRVDLLLVDIDVRSLSAVTDEARGLGVSAVGIECDLSSPTEISRLLERVLSEEESLDLLINNAGIAYYGATHEMSDAEWSRILAINLLAPIQIVRGLLPMLLEKGEAHIVNIGSMAGLVAGAKLAAYNTTKFGLQGWSESLIAEYGRSGLRVTSICPGFVNTNIFQRTFSGSNRQRDRTPPRWLMVSPESVARKTIRAIRGNQPLVVITPLARALWFLKRVWPTAFLRLFQARFRRGSRLRLATAPVKTRSEGIPAEERKCA
jgi:short-subunit dehydrogenase